MATRVTARTVHNHPRSQAWAIRLYLDGKPAAVVEDEGRGGALRWSPMSWDDAGYVRLNEVKALLATKARSVGATPEPAEALCYAFGDGAQDEDEAARMWMEYEQAMNAQDAQDFVPYAAGE